MPGYTIDRSRLESLPTEEIERILREESDDYTPEALSIFKEILKARGVDSRQASNDRHPAPPKIDVSSIALSSVLPIRTPSDGVLVLNKLLMGLFDGTMEPRVVEIGVQVVNSILRAMEQDFLAGSEEES